MSGWMPAHLFAATRPLRSFAVAAAVLTGVVVPVVLPGAVASADEVAGQTLEGRLVQTWAEAEPADAGHGHGADGMVSWVEPAEGDPVQIDSAGVEGVPSGSTVAVTVGSTS